MTDLTAVSLFAGVGGFDLALERNGVNVVAAVEIDNNARGVLKHRFPNTTLFTDVCEVTGEQLIATGFIPERGIITGGFPCQDLSVAGKRAGLDGARSGLFWEICRLLDETKARYFILENVPGLLSSNNGRDMGAVIGALVDRGYGVAYRVLDAQFFGVPQRRRRVVIVGCLGNDGSAPSQVLALSESVRGDSAPRKQTRKEAAGKIADGAGSGGWKPVANITGPLTVGDHVGGAGTVNGQDAYSGQLVVGAFPIDDGREVEKHQNGTGIGDINAPAYTLDTRQHGSVIAFYSTGGGNDAPAEEISPALKVGSSLDIASPPAILVEGHRVGDVRLTEEVSPTVKARWGTGGGNVPAVSYGFAHGQGSDAYGLAITENGTPPLRANAGGNTVPAVHHSSTVRRLTPLECERLQGFSDYWTQYRYDFKKQEVVPQADSARYKQMGNAVAVPVFEWVIKRLVALDAAQIQLEEQGGAA